MQTSNAVNSGHQTEYPRQQQTTARPGQPPQLYVQTVQTPQLHQPQQQQAYAPVTTQPVWSSPGIGYPQLQSQPQPQPAPAATTDAIRAETVMQAAAALEQAANAGMKQEFFAPPDMKFCRFSDVKMNPQYLTVEKGALHVEPSRINGHLVAPNTIAMQAPITNDRHLYDFYCVMQQQHVGLILDLTEECDKNNHQIRYHVVPHVTVNRPDRSTSNAFIRIGDATSERWSGDVDVLRKSVLVRIYYRTDARPSDGVQFGIPPAEYSTAYLNFPIRDFGSASAANIGLLVNKLKEWRNENPGKKVAVHCTAGVGRSGTIIAAEQLREKFDAGSLNHQNLLSALAEIIIDIRNARSPSMVQSPAQFRCLIEYGLGLLKGSMQ